MLGTAGGEAFDELADRYGGLMDKLTAANVAAGGEAEAARGRVAESSKAWQNVLDRSNASRAEWDATGQAEV